MRQDVALVLLRPAHNDDHAEVLFENAALVARRVKAVQVLEWVVRRAALEDRAGLLVCVAEDLRDRGVVVLAHLGEGVIEKPELAARTLTEWDPSDEHRGRGLDVREVAARKFGDDPSPVNDARVQHAALEVKAARYLYDMAAALVTTELRR